MPQVGRKIEDNNGPFWTDPARNVSYIGRMLRIRAVEILYKLYTIWKLLSCTLRICNKSLGIANGSEVITKQPLTSFAVIAMFTLSSCYTTCNNQISINFHQRALKLVFLVFLIFQLRIRKPTGFLTSAVADIYDLSLITMGVIIDISDLYLLLKWSATCPWHLHVFARVFYILKPRFLKD